ncbi:MAG: CDP-alcohol phosphatidyltransferase family protein [Euryarchaeota archaeon]|nr:CDP-alcohol phosphatidyltransferase family protein [Euryarchaeota archaeon]
MNAEERIPILRMLTLADYFTMWNGLLGFSAIVATSLREFPLAFSLLMVAVLMDGVDGGVARLGYGGGRLGDKLDTLSDLVSFCVAPAFLFYSSYSNKEFFPKVPVPAWLHPEEWGQATLIAVCVLYLLLGMLRLARFDYLKGGARHDYFVGVTTPSAAVIAASVSVLAWDATPAIIVLLAAAFLMVSRIRLPKVRHSLIVPSIAILVSAAVLGDRLNNAAPIALLVFSLAYLVFGPGYVRRREEESLEAVVT